MPATDLRPPSIASASGGWTPSTGDVRATVYGPAVLGTVQIDDPHTLAAVAALRAPAIPRPPPIAAPPPPRTSRLAIIGAALALPLPPLGLIVSTVALARILGAHPRRRGEALAVLGVAASVIALVAALAIALG